MWLWLALFACGEAPDRYALTGTVVEVRDDALLVAHDDIPGFMDAMTMPLPLANPGDRARVSAGDTIAGTLIVGKRIVLTDLEVTARSAAAATANPTADPTKRAPIGARFPITPVPLTNGDTLTLGAPQLGPVAVTFLYTRCPLPEFCPLVTQRMLSLQADLPKNARMVAVTIDPAYDTLTVLKAYGEAQGAEPGRFDFGYVPKDMLVGLAEAAGLTVHGEGMAISHDLVLLILGPDGTLQARYNDMKWDRQEVLGRLGG